MKTTIDRIAADCGVSVATVSRVIANKNNVSEETRNKIIKRMHELDYATDKLNKLMGGNKKKTILFIAENLERTSNVSLYRSVVKTFNEFDYLTVLCECEDAESRKKMVEYARNTYSGCLLISGTNGNAGLREFENTDFPMVAIHWCNDFGNVNSVIDDLKRAAYLAVKLLHEKGHKHIALVGACSKASGYKEMVQGYSEAFEDCRLEMNENLIYCSDLSNAGGAEIIDNILENYPEVTAVICANQNLVHGAMMRLSLLGKNVPDDMSFVALNADTSTPGLITCIGTSSDKMGSLAVRMLHDIINGNNTFELPGSAKILLAPEVVEGKTVKDMRKK